MSRTYSAYLDIIRFIAALAVFLAHLSSRPFTDNLLWWPLDYFGSAAVTLFFVLSGYIISYVVAHREDTPKAYYKSRLSRLYSVVLIALPLTFALDMAGMALNPDFYANQKVLWKPESWAGYLSAFFLVNEYQIFGFNGISPGTNGPFWSLSFEATYYLLAGLALFSKRIVWIPATLIILMLAGRTITAMLPLWLLGFALYRLRVPALRSKMRAQVLLIGSALLIVLSPLLQRYLPQAGSWLWLPWGRAPFNRDIVYDYYIASAFAIHLFAAQALMQDGFRPLERMAGFAHWLGSLTFPLYALHYPMFCLLAALCPGYWTPLERVMFIATLTGLMVILITPFATGSNVHYEIG
ncbi:acyltransferase family protein [Chitinimonas naiadis]